MKILHLAAIAAILLTACGGAKKYQGYKVHKEKEISKATMGEAWCLPIEKAKLLSIGDGGILVILETPSGEVYSVNGTASSALSYPKAKDKFDISCLDWSDLK